MISEKLAKALNDQYNLELESGHAYLAMQAWLADQTFEGSTVFMQLQAEEEYEHALRFFHFICDTGNRVTLHKFPEPKNEFASFREVFEDALAHEQLVTKKIHELYEMALKEKSYETVEFLNWFVKEQVEEEDTMETILEKIDMVENSKIGLYQLDKELGKREEE